MEYEFRLPEQLTAIPKGCLCTSLGRCKKDDAPFYTIEGDELTWKTRTKINQWILSESAPIKIPPIDERYVQSVFMREPDTVLSDGFCNQRNCVLFSYSFYSADSIFRVSRQHYQRIKRYCRFNKVSVFPTNKKLKTKIQKVDRFLSDELKALKARSRWVSNEYVFNGVFNIIRIELMMKWMRDGIVMPFSMMKGVRVRHSLSELKFLDYGKEDLAAGDLVGIVPLFQKVCGLNGFLKIETDSQTGDTILTQTRKMPHIEVHRTSKFYRLSLRGEMIGRTVSKEKIVPLVGTWIAQQLLDPDSELFSDLQAEYWKLRTVPMSVEESIHLLKDVQINIWLVLCGQRKDSFSAPLLNAIKQSGADGFRLIDEILKLIKNEGENHE